MLNMRFTKSSDKAVTPTRGTKYSAGYDLYSIKTAIIKPGETMKFGTGLHIEIPNGYFGAIFARSGLATKKGLRPANCVGVIDSDYRGEVIVPLHNDSENEVVVSVEDKIAQLVILPFLQVEFKEATSLTDTDRGSGGFGSTGK